MARKNGNTSRAFLVIWILCVFKVFENHVETCVKQDECSCKKTNGKIINLRKIDGGSTAAFKDIKDSDSTQNFVYAWNPCTKFSEGDGCQNVLMCQETPGTTDYKYPCAATGAKFEVIDGITYITYDSITYEEHKRSFQIGLKCDESKYPGEVEKVTQHSVGETSGYSTTLTSRCACDDGCLDDDSGSSGGLSAGSILLIVFFVLIIVYVIGGILFNKYKVGVKSMPEMCPNYEFWAGIPSLIKDGVMFTIGGIKSACSSLCQKCKKEGYADM